MDVSRDTAFQLRLGAPEDMLVTFDGLKRPVGVALQALFAARHAASTQYWADVVNNTCHTIDDLRAVMARRVPPPTADYYFGAADREITMGDNERAFREARLKPRMGLHLDTVTMHTTVLGQAISLPVIAAPVGSLRNLWPRGEAVAAAAVGKAGSICTLSTLTGTRLEEVKEAANGPCWFQLYLVGGKDVARKSIARAQASGYAALVLTIDTPVAGRRLRDKRNGAETLINGTWTQKLPYTLMMVRHERWFTSFCADGGLMEFPNIVLDSGKAMPYADIAQQLQASAVTWDDIPWIRDAWHGPIVIKGVHSVEDAQRAVACGAEAIVISNHGGRQLDQVCSTLEVLHEVVPALQGANVEILMDGGIRSGLDVLMALATGAKAVLIGRAYAYGLGAGGEAGVTKAFDIIRGEIAHNMRLLGCQSITELNASYVAKYPFETYGMPRVALH